MAQNEEEEQGMVTTPSASVSLIEKVEYRFKQLKEHAEAYPYVWASYIVVYGGFGLWTAYRWRRLRRTEDRVRALQGRLRKVVEAEESAASKSKAPPKEEMSGRNPPPPTTVQGQPGPSGNFSNLPPPTTAVQGQPGPSGNFSNLPPPRGKILKSIFGGRK